MNKFYFEWMKTPKMDVVFLATSHEKMFPSVVNTPNGLMINRPGHKELDKHGRMYMAPAEIDDVDLEKLAEIADHTINDKKTMWRYVDKMRTIKTPIVGDQKES